MFFINQDQDLNFTFGEGDPNPAYNAIGNLTPIILSNYRPNSNIRSPIAFGSRNIYDESVEANISQIEIGSPRSEHEDNLTQRSIGRYGDLGAGQGMIAVGINLQANLLFVLGRDNDVASTEAEHEHKSALEHFRTFAVTDAVAFDVSTSSTFMTRNATYVSPSGRKNNSIEVGFKLTVS